MISEIQTKLTHYMNQVGSYRLMVETCILGALILENEQIPQVYHILEPKNFTGSHQIIYHTIREMHTEKEPIDILTLSHRLRVKNISAYEIAMLTTKVNSAANIIHHAAILLELSIMQSFISMYASHCSDKKVEAFGEDILQELVLEAKPMEIIRDAMEWIVDKLPQSSFAEEIREFHHSVNKRFELITERIENHKRRTA